LESRTIYTILAKPVRRFEFLLGKYVGMLLLITVSVVLMSALFGVMLWFKESGLTGGILREAPRHAGVPAESVQKLVAQIRAEAYDPDLVKGILLIGVKLAVLAAITLLISTFATSMVFNVTVSLMIFFAGHLVSATRELWQAQPAIRYLLLVIPDLGMFNVADDVILGNAIPWAHVGHVALYGGVYLGAVLAAAHFLFADREI
jgi:ABC-type transport system involved in multi-copper enzyme maturation permease subunit